MCLVVARFRLHADAPLVVAANRDEWLARPAAPMAVLAAGQPAILGGRDEEAGGTWLAVGAHGVVAALTNRPHPAGRKPGKRSRGELPLALAGYPSAAAAAAALPARFQPGDFNAAWLLVGDREALFYVDFTGPEAIVTSLLPGVHVLENRALEAPSPKARHVRRLLDRAVATHGTDLEAALHEVVRNHDVPADLPAPAAVADGFERPAATEAACVHAGPYGTRWSGIVTVPSSRDALPRFRYADGRPCEAEFSSAAWPGARGA